MHSVGLDIFLGQESLESALKLTSFDADHYRRRSGLNLPVPELFVDFICRGRYVGLTARPFSEIASRQIRLAAALPDTANEAEALVAHFQTHNSARRVRLEQPTAEQQEEENVFWRMLLPQGTSVNDVTARSFQEKRARVRQGEQDILEAALTFFLDTPSPWLLGSDLALLLHDAALLLARPLPAEYFLLCHHFGIAWCYPAPLRCHYNVHPYTLIGNAADAVRLRDATLVGGLPAVIAADHRAWGWHAGHTWLEESPYCLGIGAGYVSLQLRKTSQTKMAPPCIPLWHRPHAAGDGVPAECYGGILSLAEGDGVPVIHRHSSRSLRRLLRHLSEFSPFELGNWDRLECEEVVLPAAHDLSRHIIPLGERLAAKLVAAAGDGEAADAIRESVEAATLFFRVSQKEATSLTVPAFNNAIETITRYTAPTNHPTKRPQLANPLVVILATRLFDIGGHSRIIEDIREALDAEAQFRIILTDIGSNQAETVRPWLSPPVTPVLRLDGDSAEAKLVHGLRYLSSQAVDLLLDASHPFDSIALGLMRHCHARRRVHLLHADHSFSLRPTAKDCLLMSVTPAGQAIAESLAAQAGNDWAHLPMTCDDPWPAGTRHHTSLPAEMLTATSGHFVKFQDHAGLRYADLLNARFRARPGQHVHIGPLPPERKKALLSSLEHPGWIDRFRHIDRVPSLSRALADLSPHLYLNSFPLAGIKAAIEAMAAGCAVCHRQTGAIIDGAEIFYRNALSWKELNEFETLLGAIGDAEIDRQRKMARRHYELHHSRTAFGVKLYSLFWPDGQK